MAPSCLATAFVIVANATGVLPAMALIRPVCVAFVRATSAASQSTSRYRSGVAENASAVGQSRMWIVTPFPWLTIPTIWSPGNGWQHPA